LPRLTSETRRSQAARPHATTLRGCDVLERNQTSTHGRRGCCATLRSRFPNHNGTFHMFTPKTLSFLRSLKRNNKREWFHERRDQYEAHCRGPLREVVERLGEDLTRIAPEMLVDPKVNLLRPFRDTRFSEDKTPLKTHIAATIPNRQLGRM